MNNIRLTPMLRHQSLYEDDVDMFDTDLITRLQYLSTSRSHAARPTSAVVGVPEPIQVKSHSSIVPSLEKLSPESARFALDVKPTKVTSENW